MPFRICRQKFILEKFRINENREAILSAWKNFSSFRDLSSFRMKIL